MTLPTLGIDISKLKFDICLSREGGKFHHKVFPNSPADFSQLSTWLAKYKVERVHATHFGSHPGLQEQRDLLLSIPGIGATTAAKLLSEILP
ncbi:MAG: hypothetical protein H0U54_14405 [Acidobacteria bacterium]|jgi:transposase|nr:hypothetical protein [Acidobacteriota bacterium]